MPRQKNPNPQRRTPKLLKISNAKNREKHTLFKKAHSLFGSAFTKYQSGVNPKQKASADLLLAGNRAKHLATIATQRGNGAHIASKTGRARYQKRQVKNIHTINDSLPNAVTSFKVGKKTMELNPKEPPLLPPPVPPFMHFNADTKHHHTFETR